MSISFQAPRPSCSSEPLVFQLVSLLLVLALTGSPTMAAQPDGTPTSQQDLVPVTIPSQPSGTIAANSNLFRERLLNPPAAERDDGEDENSFQDLWKHARSTSRITHVEGSKPLFVFYDPLCPHCHDLFDDIHNNQSIFQEENVRVNWIPVAFLSPREKGLILGTSHLIGGRETFIRDMSGEEIEHREDESVGETIKRNSEVLTNSTEDPGTPTLIFRTKDHLRILVGRPRLERLKKIAGQIQ